MSAEEQGLYRNLIDEVWLREDHIIPDDPKILAKVSGDYEAWEKSGKKILKWMKRVEGGWTNDTALEVIRQSERRAENQKFYRERKKQRNDNTPDNASDNGADNTTDNKPASPSPSPSPSLYTVSVSKKIYGSFQNVKLTDKEYQGLIDKFGIPEALKKIENLSEGIASKGYKYKSHYATILSWDRRDNKNNGNQRVSSVYTRPEEID